MPLSSRPPVSPSFPAWLSPSLARGLAALIFCSLFLVASAPAQSVASLAPAPPASHPAEPPPTSTPSRYIEPASLDTYVKSISSSFAIAKRQTDPFGRPQDPSAKITPQNTGSSPAKRPTAITATPLSEIINKIMITTIMPKDRKFLIGTRSFSQGEVLPLVFRGRHILVRIENVSPSQITFRNTESGETASRKLDLLPPGMTAGNGSITAPGMVPDRPNAPIELESSDPPSDTSSNR